MSLQSVICLLLTGISLCLANVEKAIFLGPEPVNIPQTGPSLANLYLDVLSPEDWSLRTLLDAVFPTAELPRGVDAWLILDRLTEGQRYEVRVCWLATQPTAFHLETYDLPTVFETPALITSLHNYSMTRQPSQDPPSPASSQPSTTRQKTAWSPASSTTGDDDESSILFLRISAAADYFTLNSALMHSPEPVVVDLILDPFLANVLPRSLVPTVGFIVLVVAASWVLARGVVVPYLTRLMAVVDDEKKEQ
ncbi:hypothetical protein BD289DRAFT_455699 [Coniella lustricola]|uniref:Uncharacterized protein n=1 Tax=Coniella lustricola TaxID=2025994 RepID=A0A2T2ZYR8_9PEZI|nr:hypothetical protein BD289DRAFT_455699 [Coniella lustricola]